MNVSRIGLVLVPMLVAVLARPAASNTCREDELDAQGKCPKKLPTTDMPRPDGRDGQLRLAVMEFANTSPDRQLDSLGKGLQSMVTTDLAQVASLALVERARLRDIQGELKLGQSALVDPKTAAKFGKLAGASHLIAGSFTVVGDKMRIDGRIFAVADGKVVLAEKIEGDRDAFFELEKTLVKKIVDTVGVKLQAKERGAIAKVHTTDFESFRDFSNGVALFDEQKYSEAIEALRAAQDRDQDFKLATVTLAQYQDIISRLAARADELQATQSELQNLTQQKQARGEAEALKKLHEVAGRKDAKDPLDRLAALYLLATAYGDISNSTHDLYRMQLLEDRFALQRIADTLVQSYWAEASAIFPRVLPVVRDELGFLPKTLEQVDEALAKARKQLEDGRVHTRIDCLRGNAREVQFLCNLDWQGLRDDPIHQFPLRLHLDGRQAAELYQRLYDFGVKLNAPPEWRQRALAGLATEYRSLGDMGRATAAYTQLAGILHDANEVRAVTQKVQDNRSIAEALARSPHKDLIRELMANGSHTDLNRVDPVSVGRDIASFDKDPKYLLGNVGHSRMFPESGHWGWGNADIFVLIAEHPVWQVQAAQFALGTGPRPDPRRASAIRYAPDMEVAGEDTLLVIDGAARRDVRLAFDVDFAVPADFWPFRRDTSPYRPDAKGRHPEVGFVFGMRNIYAEPEKDPRTQKEVIVRPCRALAVIVGDGGVRLEELVQEGEGNAWAGVAHRGMTFVHKELGRQKLDLRSARIVKAAFEVAGDKVTATVNGKAYAFPVPKDHQGFYGVGFAGNGFAELHGLTVSAK
jgi:TolB-like protein